MAKNTIKFAVCKPFQAPKVHKMASTITNAVRLCVVDTANRCTLSRIIDQGTCWDWKNEKFKEWVFQGGNALKWRNRALPRDVCVQYISSFRKTRSLSLEKHILWFFAQHVHISFNLSTISLHFVTFSHSASRVRHCVTVKLLKHWNDNKLVMCAQKTWFSYFSEYNSLSTMHFR